MTLLDFEFQQNRYLTIFSNFTYKLLFSRNLFVVFLNYQEKHLQKILNFAN